MADYDSNGAERGVLWGYGTQWALATGEGAAAAQVQITVPGVAGKFTYISGFHAQATAPTSTVAGTITVTNIDNNGSPQTLTYEFVESSTLGGDLPINFPFPLKASGGVNQQIVVTVAAITSGGKVCLNAFGFYGNK